jgi:8-oxo-dGTP pyrophosphatase MutT (NUDIX family)
MNDLADRLTRIERVEDDPSRGPVLRPRDAATLVLLDRSRKETRVLVGKRNEKHVFLPGKFVFPGGSVDASDRRMFSVGKTDPVSARRLRKRVTRPSQHLSRSLMLTAIRETCEETGLLIGRRMKRGSKARKCPGDWKTFEEHGVVPDLSMLTYVARAITPPGRSRRFDTRFFIADKEDVAGSCGDPSGPDSELVELKWMPMSAAKGEADLPTISKVVLIEIEKRLSTKALLPVPFYYFRRGAFRREEIA